MTPWTTSPQLCRAEGGAPFPFALQRFATERTEPATPRRRQEARRRGQVARTGELGTGLTLLAVVLALSGLGRFAVDTMLRYARQVLGGGVPGGELTQAGAYRLLVDAVLAGAQVAGPLLAAAALVGVAGQLVQVGFLVSGEPLKVDFSRINPVRVLQRLWSRRALAELVKSVFKVVLIGYPVYRAVRQGLDLFPSLMEMPPPAGMAAAAGMVYRTALSIGVALVGLAGLDYLYQRWEMERSLRMTKQELKEELRETEGDPRVRARIRQRMRQLASARMMQRVPTADVVITNPTHLAVALRYDEATMEAPEVVAKGAGLLAERIRQVAEAHGVHVVQNPPLAQALFEAVEVGEPIPPEFYRAVAEVLAFVYRLRRGRAGQ